MFISRRWRPREGPHYLFFCLCFSTNRIGKCLPAVRFPQIPTMRVCSDRYRSHFSIVHDADIFGHDQQRLAEVGVADSTSTEGGQRRRCRLSHGTRKWTGPIPSAAAVAARPTPYRAGTHSWAARRRSAPFCTPRHYRRILSHYFTHVLNASGISVTSRECGSLVESMNLV